MACLLGIAESRLGEPEKEKAPPALCAEALVHETCALLRGPGVDGTQATEASVSELLSASEDAVGSFWKVAGLTLGSPVLCADLCHNATALLKRSGRVVPPRSDTGCYARADDVVCDLDLSPVAIRKLAGQSVGDFANSKGEGAPQNASFAKEVAQAKVVDYSPVDVAARVAQLFRIYPSSGPAVQIDEMRSAAVVAKAEHSIDQKELIEQRLGQSQAYVTLAMRNFAAGGTRSEAEKFFSDEALSYGPARRRILGTLNSISKVLSHSRIVEGESCKSTMFAYVQPCGLGPLEKDSAGRYYLFLCDLFFSVAEEQICTLVHEASHHSTACTKDIVYGARQCMQLAQSNWPYALFNADNYGYYIREVARSHGTF